MSIRYDGRVAIVTGAAAGLGRSHALALAARGAKVVVNDFGGVVHGTDGYSEPAEKVAAGIRQAGGEAISNGAAKSGLIGLMNVLQIEGTKYGIRVNALCPSASTRMTQGLLPDAALALMTPEDVTPAALFLVSDDAPQRTILSAVAGGYSRVVIQETQGVFLDAHERTPETIAARFGEISDLADARHCEEPGGPGLRFVKRAARAAGVSFG